ncbi:ribonuclease domain-containing protein [Streptomyces purpurogeneiscleroticus]|uniref:ribonuclease domain-containing protein n=1 Tax=Streptomyces purpurogeneiscleroticus TaxID=68259 RepID=UPI001CBD9141|nr:ribonuclease domain-containing protein [Streptomyces purpurogeneiscleroticus]MBZ4019762.1 ribonuclease [Streptomyces purpurogeneiscleroticus]
MRIPPRITRIGALGALASALFLAGPTAVAAAPATAPAAVAYAAPAASVHATSVHAAAVGEICYSKLPGEAHETLDLIDKGGPYPYPQDGGVFSNREGVLPQQPSGYYHEYTVETPGSPDRGARRIVTGEQTDEDYYTADHYETFDLVDRGC